MEEKNIEFEINNYTLTYDSSIESYVNFSEEINDKGKQLLRQKDGRVRKITQNYQRVADTIALEDWEALKASYVQAKRFALQLSEWDIRIND